MRQPKLSNGFEIQFTGYLRELKPEGQIVSSVKILGLIFEELMTSPARPELPRYPGYLDPSIHGLKQGREMYQEVLMSATTFSVLSDISIS